MKVLAVRITALIVMLASPPARGQAPQIPGVSLRVLARGLSGACVWNALDRANGPKALLPSGSGEPAWEAHIEWTHTDLLIRLVDPDGGEAASKRVSPKPTETPCWVAGEVLSVLLAAHAAHYGTPPTGDDSAPVPRAIPAPSAGSTVPAQTETPEPAAPHASSAHPENDGANPASAMANPEARETLRVRRWDVRAGLGVGMLPLNLAAVAGATFRPRFSTFLLGLEFAGSGQRIQVANGIADIRVLLVRVLLGYGSGPGVWGAEGGGLAGLRWTHGATTELAESGSADIASAELGLYAAGWRTLSGPLKLGLRASVSWLVPNPAFAVTGKGNIYEASRPVFEVMPVVGWEF